MEEIDIKDEKLQRLMKAAHNAGGTLESDMLEALKKVGTEKEFERGWHWMLRNEMNRLCGFYNDLAERLGQSGFELKEV
ncbi:MAG: hypothetical protein WA130_04015 [Candidatus Methanoperedens sp.]|nr:MAG: hypothetical protein OI719_00150 [Candidatus Methanoperedens sp.]